MKLKHGWLIFPLVLFASGLALAEEDRHTRPDSGGGTSAKTPAVSNSPDTSMLTGSGLNTTSGPVDRPVSGGVMRKDPGSRTWYFVKALSDAELKLEYDRHLQELVRKYGHEPRDIVIQVNDTTDVGKLRAFRIGVQEVPPCTVAVRVLYRQLPELKQAGLLFWGKGERRPTPGADKRLKQPPKSPSPDTGPPPGGGKRTPPPLSSSRSDGLPSTQAVVFSDGFEGAPLPNSNWNVGDFNSFSGLDYWSDLSAGCGYVRSGSYSASASGFSDTPCFAYDNDQDAYLQNPYFFDMSGYSSYTASFWVRLDSEFNYDFFRAYYNTGGGWLPWYAASGSSGGWIQRTLSVNNAGHIYDDFAFLFKFESDYLNASGAGAYVDDVLLDGTLGQSNLTYYTPPGWSFPIVPSAVLGTTTVGTLYAAQPTYIDWAIQNNGNSGTSSTFYVDYYLDGNLIGFDTVFGLNAGTAHTRTDWSYTVPTSGNHTLKMVIDPTNAVSESNESVADNTYERTFFWNPPPFPDLIVQSLTVTPPNPPVGGTVDVAITIKNQGTASTSCCFATDFYRNRASAPGVGQLGDDTHNTVVAINPGATETFHFFVSSAVATTWTSWAQVDRADAIEENTNEGNNVYGPVSIAWTPGLVSASGTFTYDDSLLGSNRPLRCVRVVLYDSDGGGAADDSLTETSTNASGQWGPISLTNRDTDTDQGLLDLYARVYFTTRGSCLGDSVVGVKDYYGERWFFNTPVVTNIANGSYSFGTVKPTTYGTKTAAHLYATILRGYDYVKAVGSVPPFVFVRWTPGDGLTTAYAGPISGIFIMGGYSYITNPLRLWPDEWDDGVVLHEYGHHLGRFFNYQHIPPGPYSHLPDTISTSNGVPSREVAWAEGAAWYIASQVLGTQAITNWGDSLGMKTRDTLDVERGIYWDSVSNRTVNVNDRGDVWEGSNAGVLRDIADALNDNPNGDVYSDHLTSTSAAVWDALVNTGGIVVNHAYDFYRVYQPRYAPASQPQLQAALNQVYCEHGMCPQVVGVPDPVLPLVWGQVRSRPNPFRGLTWIELSVPATGATGSTRVAVFDVAGRLVRTLVNRPLEPGEQTVIWNGLSEAGRPAPAGLYYGKLEAPGTSQTFRMLLLR